MNIVRLVTFVAFTALPMVSSAYVVLDTQSFGSSIYKLVATDTSGTLSSGISWTDAEAAAVDLGGHLATVNDWQENDFLYTTWGTSVGGLWIGLNDAATEGVWEWVSGEVSSGTNWQPGIEPSGDGDYVHIWGSTIGGTGTFGGTSAPLFGTWNDSPASYTQQFGSALYGVVELAAAPVPAPASLGLLGLGLAGLGLRKRAPR